MKFIIAMDNYFYIVKMFNQVNKIVSKRVVIVEQKNFHFSEIISQSKIHLRNILVTQIPSRSVGSYREQISQSCIWIVLSVLAPLRETSVHSIHYENHHQN